MKIADAAAHTMYFLYPLFPYHLQVVELEAILVVTQTDLVVLEAHEGHEVSRNCGHCGSKEKSKLVYISIYKDIDIFRSHVQSAGADVANHNHCPRRSNADKPPRQLVWFSTQLAAKM